MLAWARVGVKERGRVVAVVVNLDEERGRGRKPSLDELQRLVNEDLRVVNELILKHMHSPVPLIP